MRILAVCILAFILGSAWYVHHVRQQNIEELRRVLGLDKPHDSAETNKHANDAFKGPCYSVISEFMNVDPVALKVKAEHGDASAQAFLGEIYHRGWTAGGINKDAVEAVEWFKRAASQGKNPWDLAWAYMTGEGVSKDYSEAYFWAMTDMKTEWPPHCESLAVLSEAVRHLSIQEITAIIIDC